MSKNVGGLYVELSADNKKLNQSVENSIEKLQEAQETINNMNDASLDGVKSSLQGINEQIKSIKVSSQMVNQSLEDFKNELSNMKPEEVDELFDSSINKVQELQNFIGKINDEITRTGEFWTFDSVLEQSKTALESYTEKLKAMEEVMQDVPTETFDEVTNSIENSKKGLLGFIADFKQGIVDGFKEATNKAKETKEEIKNVSNEIKRTDNNCKEFGKNIGKNFKKGINSLKRFALALLGIRTGFSYLITNMRAYINSSDALKSKTEGIAQALQQSLAPYAELAVSALQKVVHWVILAIGYFTTFINTIFGTKIAIGGMTKNMKNLTAGTKAAGKAAKDALAPFDELNILQEGNDSGGGAGGVSPDFSGLGLDEVDMSGLDKFAEKLSELKTIAFNIFDNIKAKIKEAWDSKPVQSFVGFANAYGGFLLNFWTTMGQLLYENITTTWNNIQSDVSLIWTNLTELWTMFWTDMTDTINKWGPTIIDDVAGVFNSIWKDAIDPAIQIATHIFADFTQILKDNWDKYGGELLDSIAEAVDNIVKEFQSIWDNIIKPIIEPFLEQLRWLWDTKLKKIVDNVIGFVAELIDLGLMIYNKFIAPINNWLREKLLPIWTSVWNTIWGVTSSIIGMISDVISGVITTLRGIIKFIKGVFSWDWEMAWEGIKGIFSGIFESLGGIVKGVLNVIIDVINGFVRGINKIKFDVPDWVPGIGGKRWGFNIKTINKLATGTVATEPQVAEIAEYTGAKTNPEIVSPRDMMYDTMVKALRETRQNNGTNNDMTLTLNVKYEDGRTIIRKINAAQDEAGRTLLEV